MGLTSPTAARATVIALVVLASQVGCRSWGPDPATGAAGAARPVHPTDTAVVIAPPEPEPAPSPPPSPPTTAPGVDPEDPPVYPPTSPGQVPASAGGGSPPRPSSGSVASVDRPGQPVFRVDSVFRTLRETALDLKLPAFEESRTVVVTLRLTPDAVQPETLIVEPTGERRFLASIKLGDYAEACLTGDEFDIRVPEGDGECSQQLVAAGMSAPFTWQVTPQVGDTLRTLLLTVRALVDGDRRLPVHSKEYPVQVVVAPCNLMCGMGKATDWLKTVNGLVTAGTVFMTGLLIPVYRRWKKTHAAPGTPAAPAATPEP